MEALLPCWGPLAGIEMELFRESLAIIDHELRGQENGEREKGRGTRREGERGRKGEGENK